MLKQIREDSHPRIEQRRKSESMEKSQRAATFAVVVVVSVATIAIAESKKEFRFTVGPHANVTIMNQFGPISLKPGAQRTW